jgi:TusA-related sulfurtransferase
MRCLETKWGIIKHDIPKFIKNFGVVEVFQKSNVNHETSYTRP